MNTRLDPVVVDLNRYMAHLARDESREAAIERRTAELMARDGGYSPADAGNFGEAMSELVADSKYAEDLQMILAGIEQTVSKEATEAQHAFIGQRLAGFLKGYWTKYARNLAETQIGDSCPHCFGKGCRKCEAPERD